MDKVYLQPCESGGISGKKKEKTEDVFESFVNATVGIVLLCFSPVKKKSL